MRWRSVGAVLSRSLVALTLLCAPVRADYSDGVAAQKAVSLEEGIAAWRQAAWQEDDFLSEMRLADIYADPARSKYYDPVEAYVWYYLASRSAEAHRNDDDQPGVADLIGRDRHRALAQQTALLLGLDSDARTDARNRIVYILSCRGAEGFITLGRIYDTQSQLNDIDYWEGDPGRGRRRSNSDDLRLVGLTSRSVITPNDGDALAFFRIADGLGDPLAHYYLGSIEQRLRGSEIGRRLIQDEADRAQAWSPVYEFYPPADNDSGIPYTDECRIGFTRARALSLVPKLLPKADIEEALRFLGWGRQGVRGVERFQLTLGHDATGLLTAADAVRAIQTAAVRGDAHAQNALGVMYAKGIGVALNYVRAAAWFQKAADQRYGAALYHLGVLYKVGPAGIRQDLSKANDYFTAAALAGFAPSRNQLKELLSQASDRHDDH